jgi:hypothetical protein
MGSTEPRTTEHDTVIERAVVDAQNLPFRRRLAAGLALIMAALIAMGVLLWVSYEHGQSREQSLADNVSTYAGAIHGLQTQVRSLGGTPIKVPGLPGVAGPQGPGPSEAQIDSAVQTYLRAHPPAKGQSATPAMVAKAVGQFLTAHPPTPPKAPTAAQISSAASTYIAAHAAEFLGATGQNGKDGSNGSNGTNGQNATDEQVAAAVSTFCSAHNSCTGPAGVNGQPGTDGKPPEGWSWTDPITQVHYTCTRNAESPDSAPTYACSGKVS